MLAICSKINLEKLPWNSFWKRIFTYLCMLSVLFLVFKQTKLPLEWLTLDWNRIVAHALRDMLLDTPIIVT